MPSRRARRDPPMSPQIGIVEKQISVSRGLTRVPRHLKVTPTMVDDFTIDPCLGAYVIMRVKFDVAQMVRLRLYWWTPDVIDSSGLGTGKSLVFFVWSALRCVIIGDQWGCAYYQRFQSLKDIFWPYFDTFNSSRAPIFAAQLGQRVIEGEEQGKTGSKGASCYKQYFKNESILFGPAPGWITGAMGQAGLTFNFIGVDEWTKVEAMAKSGKTANEAGNPVSGIDQQVVGRVRRHCWNQHHPIWCNHRLFLATAESLRHPGYQNYKKHLDEAESGNPGYAVFSMSFKDFSNLPMENDIRIDLCTKCGGRGYVGSELCPECLGDGKCLTSTPGKPFREVVPDWKTLQLLNKRYTRGHWLREGLGIWARETQGWYSEAALQRCVETGIANGLEPECVRGRIPGARYFLGIDPAAAQSKKADDGGLVVLRVRPKPGLPGPPTSNVGDWLAEFVWAYRVRGEKNRALTASDKEEGVFWAQRTAHWSGIIHKKHQQFSLTGLLMDTQGGGLLIWPELNKRKQTIDGEEQECVPIATVDDSSVANAQYILVMFIKEHMSELWPMLQPGVDSLYTAMHEMFQEAVEHGEVGFPLPFNERPASTTEGWEPERKWALKNLDAARSQLLDVQAATLENGQWELTRNGAKKFSSKDKKDLAYACAMAYVRFRLWLKMDDMDLEDDGGDGELGCYGV